MRTVRAGVRERTGNHVRRTERPKEALLRPHPGVSGLPEEARRQDNTSPLLGEDGVQRSFGGTVEVFDYPQLATELLVEPKERYAGSLRANPQHWSADFWTFVYEFSASDLKVVERNDD